MYSYNELSDNSKIWIYQADRVLTKDEVTNIKEQISSFVTNWTAHNRPLKAFAEIQDNLFVIFFVDENESTISGCGIDKSVHLIQEIGRQINVDFFNRMTIAYKIDDTIYLSGMSELKDLYNSKKISGSTPVFNNTIQTKNEFENSWRIPLDKSWIISRIQSNKINVQ